VGGLWRRRTSAVIQLRLHFDGLVDNMIVIEQYWGQVARVPDPSG
jgi:hypothetical protein